MDFYAIGTALAGAYDDLTPPSGEREIQSSGLPENNLASFPCVVVFPPEWEAAHEGGARYTEQTWTVRFYRGQMSGDVNTNVTALLQWANTLFSATYSASKLGLSYIRKAVPITGLIGVHTYGGTEYGVVEIEVGVWTEDAVSLSA